MTIKLKGGKVGSVKDLKSQLKKGSTQFFVRIPDEPLLVRFMEEPDEWINAFLHFDADVKASFPCADEDCPGCAAGLRKSKVYLANAVDLDAGKSVPLQMPVTVAKALVKYYDKYGTVVDRDYELSKEGTGIDTEYSVIPEGVSKVDIRRYDTFDLWDMVVTLWNDYQTALGATASDDVDDVDDDEEEAAPPPKKTTRKKVVRRPKADATPPPF